MAVPQKPHQFDTGEHYMDRRQFIKWSSFFTTTALTSGLSGCFSDSTIEPELPAAATGDGWKFPQSIASADPKPDSIVLWTRVVPLSLSDTATLPAGTQTTIRLLLTSADNSAALGSNAALSGSLLMDQAIPAYAAFDGSIRHKVTGLNANTTSRLPLSAARGSNAARSALLSRIVN
jgi:alkaline phosphatase D